MDINIFISEDYKSLPFKVLKQAAFIRWGTQGRKYVARDVKFLRRNPPCFAGFMSFYLFAQIGGKVVGFAQFFQDENNDTTWFYGDLEVLPEYRRQGIALRMLEYVLNALEGKQAARLLTFVHGENEPSIKL
ncbi:MAG: GNAT family N-acetyltransferase, partial [Defluviitaleaceae bacterium]|nr:GNAT family N-acetyltransferase [Defluviitaleaceae bacterium]